jgi:hypothetical protein
VAAICETVAPPGKLALAREEQARGFVLSSFPAMPRLLAFGLEAFTVWFCLAGIGYGGRPFFANPPRARARQWQRWRTHRLGVCRDLVRFYESLATLALYSPAMSERRE